MACATVGLAADATAREVQQALQQASELHSHIQDAHASAVNPSTTDRAIAIEEKENPAVIGMFRRRALAEPSCEPASKAARFF